MTDSITDRKLTLVEDVAVLKTQYQQLQESQKRIEEKLDELIELKNKGMGAFWFVSALFSSGVLAGAAYLFSFLQGKH